MRQCILYNHVQIKVWFCIAEKLLSYMDIY